MKAIRIHEFGGLDVLKLEDAPMPEVNEDEVLIKVYATSVNPLDIKIRKGERQQKFPTTFPLIPGWDVSGVVEGVGSAITKFKNGDEVYGRPSPLRNGAYATYITVKEIDIALKPNSVSHEEAAAVPLAGLTAWQALFDRGQLQEKQKVLIHAASGGVGTFAIQFAKWKGAYPIGTTSEKNIELVKALGAQEVIDYRNEKFDERLSGIDLVLDTLGGETQQRSLTVLKNGGRLITLLKPENQEEALKKQIHIENLTSYPEPGQLKQIADLIDNGIVRPVISEVFLLEHAADAQRLVEQGHVRGKVVIRVV